MDPFAVALLLGAAVLHAIWNYRLKRCQERSLVFWWAVVLSFLLLLPCTPWLPRLSQRAWLYVAASGLAQAAYMVLLSQAYRVGDFSLVYPIARGSAPLFLALWGVTFLHERPTLAGGSGMLLISAGLIALGGAAGRRSWAAILLALGVALCISIYSAIDGAAVKFVHPLSYFLAEWAASAVIGAPALLAGIGRGQLLAQLRSHAGDVLVIGALSAGAYLLALWAYSLAPVSYGGAIREVSVVFAAWAGWRFGGEQGGLRRLGGALLVFAGIVLIALGGA